MTNLNQIEHGHDPDEQWAIQREFDLRWRRWRVHRFGALAVAAGGVTDAMRRLSIALGGERAAPGRRPE